MSSYYEILENVAAYVIPLLGVFMYVCVVRCKQCSCLVRTTQHITILYCIILIIHNFS